MIVPLLDDQGGFFDKTAINSLPIVGYNLPTIIKDLPVPNPS